MPYAPIWPSSASLLHKAARARGYAPAGGRAGEPYRVGGAASGHADDDRVAGEADRGAASLEPGQQATSDNPRRGVIGATAIVATITDPTAFRSGRDFAAWVGLVPREEDSTGGKRRLGPISKQGDRYLRRILVGGAVSILRRAKLNPQRYPWVTRLLARRPFKVVAIALANKMARVAWALVAKGGTYRRPRLAAV